MAPLGRNIFLVLPKPSATIHQCWVKQSFWVELKIYVQSNDFDWDLKWHDFPHSKCCLISSFLDECNRTFRCKKCLIYKIDSSSFVQLCILWSRFRNCNLQNKMSSIMCLHQLMLSSPTLGSKMVVIWCVFEQCSPFIGGHFLAKNT